jgi:RNA polymerase primary sigma factor
MPTRRSEMGWNMLEERRSRGRVPEGALRLAVPRRRRPGCGAAGESLPAEEERALLARARTGDRAARDELIEANVALVISLARGFVRPPFELADLVQEGVIGLLTAMERFDPGRGTRFTTYAVYWVRQRLRRAVSSQGRLIRLPEDVCEAARRVEHVRARLTEALGREPTLDELTPPCGISRKRLEALLGCLDEPISLDAAAGPQRACIDRLANPSSADPEQLVIGASERTRLMQLLRGLSRRDQAILAGSFGLHGVSLPPTDLARQLRMSPCGLRQARHRALLKLRRHLAQRETALSGPE